MALILSNPVRIFRTVRPKTIGLEKQEEARESGKGEFPGWMAPRDERCPAGYVQKISEGQGSIPIGFII